MGDPPGALGNSSGNCHRSRSDGPAGVFGGRRPSGRCPIGTRTGRGPPDVEDRLWKIRQNDQRQSRRLTINAAFLQEIKEVNAALWELLAEAREACSHASTAKTGQRHLAGLFGRLRDQLAMHFALEEAFGYFEDPVAVAPHLSQRANDLRGQHGRLYVLIRDLADHAEQSPLR